MHVSFIFSALAVTAAVALAAAFFIDDGCLTAFGTDVPDLEHGRGSRFKGLFLRFAVLMGMFAAFTEFLKQSLFLHPLFAFSEIFLEGMPESVRQGEHPFGTEAEGTAAADTAQLSRDFFQTGFRLDG